MKTNPFYDPYCVLNRVYSEGAHLKIALAETALEELNRTRTVKTVYGVLENDGYLSLCIRTFTQKNPKQYARILLKIALYWLIFLKKPRYMVTDTAVDLCKRMGKGGMAGFFNAFLRAFDQEKVQIPQGEQGLVIRYNFPLFAVRKIREQYGARTEEILSAKSSGVTVRFLRNEERYLQRRHWDTPFEKTYIFPNFVRDEGFDAGDYTFQSLGSIAICAAVEPCANLLDACAAPGGKSVLLAQKCGEVMACELHPHRVELIKNYLARMGTTNVRAVQSDSTLFHAEWEGKFDGVLCDVPCSGLGTAAENPDLPLRKTEENFKALLNTQLQILKNCARYLKPGGKLYYSTCSILREENDDVVGAFLREDPTFTAEAVDSPLSFKRMKFGVQFLPDSAFGAGFYLSKMKKGEGQ